MSAAWRFGMNLTSTHDASSPPHIQIAEHRQSIELAKQIEGFDLVIAGQHFASPDLRYFQPIPYLASLLDVTEGLRLAVGIIILPLHHPITVAEDVATLDALTAGRAVLGVGVGYSQRELDAFGIARSARIARFEESYGVVRRLLDGQVVHHYGAHFRFDGVQCSIRPTNPGGIPMWIGAQASPSVKRAARLADAWYVPPFPTHRQLIELWGEFVAERDPRRGWSDFPVRRELFITDSHREAREALAMAEQRYAVYARWGIDMDEPEPGEWLDSRFIVGDAATVAERLTELRAAVPMTHLIYKPQWLGGDHREAMNQLERFASEVVPLLAGTDSRTG